MFYLKFYFDYLDDIFNIIIKILGKNFKMILYILMCRNNKYYMKMMKNCVNVFY